MLCAGNVAAHHSARRAQAASPRRTMEGGQVLTQDSKPSRAQVWPSLGQVPRLAARLLQVVAARPLRWPVC